MTATTSAPAGTVPPAPAGAPLLAFEVRGIPESQGSMSGFVRGGRAIVTDSNKRLKPWRAQVVAAAADLMLTLGQTTPHDGPVTVSILLALPRPASAPKRRRTFPKALDVDKGARAILDSLVACGAIYDDNRVIDLFVSKRYVGDPEGLPFPGAHITVRAVAP